MEINKGGIGKVGYPLISDLDKSIARDYDVLLGATPATVLTEEDEKETSIGGGVTLRGSFLIDALDHHNTHGDVCPAGWNKGDTGMNPSDEGMRNYLAENTDDL